MSNDSYNVNGKQIFEALKAITEDAKKTKKEKGLDFRFLDKSNAMTDKEIIGAFDKIELLEAKLDKYGITVEFYEDIDIKNTAEGCKFYFKIYDMNNCFTEIDALEYRKIVIDPNESTVDYIAEKLFKIVGLKIQADVLEISNLVAELISYVYYFDEMQYKLYENIGWDIYDNELIFKYDKIYTKDRENIRSVCSSDIAGKLTNDYSEEVKSNWRQKFNSLMNSSVVARIVISAACTGLVRSIMPYNKETNINMNIVGEPGSGKSSLSQFALSIFGNPHALEGSFIDKDNAMEIIRVKRPVIPYILDDRMLKLDTLSDKAKSKELMYDVFREYEGKVTERVGGSYKELSGQRTNAPIISSSVEPMLKVLLESGRDLGQYRRFIELELKRNEIFEGNPLVVDEYHRLAYQNYGIGIQYIVNYILEIGVKVVNDLYDGILADITERLNQKSIATNLRGLSSSASRFALVATTYIIVMEAINKKDNDVESSLTTDEEAYMIWQKINSNSVCENEELLKLLAYKADKSYIQLVDYLIDNLVDKMKVVTFTVDVHKNLTTFLTKKSNDKWFVKTGKTDFFDNCTASHIAFRQEEKDKVTIMVRGGKYIEWLMCSGKELSDEQIKEYLQVVNDGGDYKSLAEKLFGADIIRKNILDEVKKHPLLTLNNEKGSKKEKNITSISVTLPVMKDNEEQAQ